MDENQEITNALCEYFSNIGKQLVDAIPNVDKSPLEYVAESSSESFCIFPVTSQEIVDEISKLMVSKSHWAF